MLVGKASYYLYLLACVSAVVTAAAIISPEWTDYRLWPTLKALVILISNIIASPLSTIDRVSVALWNHPTPIVIVGLELLAAYLLSLWVHSCLNKAFSTVWYAKQRELRDALKAARVEMGSGGRF